MKKLVVFFNDFGVSCSEERDKTRLLYNRFGSCSAYGLLIYLMVSLNNYIILFPFSLTTQSKRT